jgi:hypothetical protein
MPLSIRPTSRDAGKEGREPDRNVLMYLRTGSAGPTPPASRIVGRTRLRVPTGAFSKVWGEACIGGMGPHPVKSGSRGIPPYGDSRDLPCRLRRPPAIPLPRTPPRRRSPWSPCRQWPPCRDFRAHPQPRSCRPLLKAQCRARPRSWAPHRAERSQPPEARRWPVARTYVRDVEPTT